VAVPDVKNKAVCVLLLRVPGSYIGAVTALNFSHSDAREEIDVRVLADDKASKKIGGDTTDILTGEPGGELSDLGRMRIDLPAMSAKTLIIRSSSN
jgi:hypothetical protein